jgi:hypothetical protein
MDEPSFDPLDEKPAKSYSQWNALEQADHLARMVCKLLDGCLVLHPERPHAGEDARWLQTLAKEWLSKFHS